MSENVLALIQSEIDKADFKVANDSFRKRLKNRKILFLDDLKHMASNDTILYRRKRSVAHSINLMKQFIGDYDEFVDSLSLDDFATFGLPEDDIKRLGYLAYQYDTIYPMDQHPEIRGEGKDAEEVDLFYDEDNANMNMSLLDAAFQTCLVRSKKSFLDDLKQMALDDYELEDQAAVLVQAFHKMILFVGDEDSPLLQNIALKDWLEFGLDQSTVTRLGYLAYRYRVETDSEWSGGAT